MATSRPPRVEIDLGGETRHMVFDLNAFERVTEAGFNVYDEEAWGALGGDPGMAKQLVWCFLRSDDPEITPDDVGAMLGLGDLRRIVETIAQGIRLSMPESEEQDEGNSTKRTRKRRSSTRQTSSEEAA